MSHYVLVQEPRRKSFYVICGDVDECLVVVGQETKTAPVGTRVTMLRSTGDDVLDVLSAWRVEKRGQARRYAINSRAVANPFTVGPGVARTPERRRMAEAIAAGFGCAPEDIIWK